MSNQTCPLCGAGENTFNRAVVLYNCRTIQETETGKTHQSENCAIAEAAKLRARVKELEELEGACRKAAVTFRRYADIHRAKGTPEANVKADENAALASEMEAAAGLVRSKP